MTARARPRLPAGRIAAAPARWQTPAESGMRPLVRWRLYPEAGSSLYVTANVWRTRAELVAYARVHLGGRVGRAQGLASSWERYIVTDGRRPRLLPHFGEVNFYRGNLGVTVITHELLHAAHAWGRRIGFDFTRLGAPDAVNADEERLCHAHSRMVHTFTRRAYAAGLYGDT